MSLNIEYWRAIFLPKLKTLIYDLICVKNIFYQATTKNDNGAVVIRKGFVRLKRKQQLH